MTRQSIADVEVHGRKVLLRMDLNVPIEEDQVLDDTNLRLALPTIRNILDRGGRLIIIAHLGLPEGHGYEADLTLKPCARRLSELLHRPVPLAPDCIGPVVREMVERLNNGDVLMLENLRFHEEEILNSEPFARELAALGDVYCNEALGVSHRRHGSIDALPRLMATCPRVAGLQLWRELLALKSICQHPLRPAVLVIGGRRMEDKIPAVVGLRDRVDTVLIGGEIALSFLAAERKSIGRTEIEPRFIMEAQHALEAAVCSHARVMLPEDHVCAKEISAMADSHVFPEVIPEGWLGMDIGPRTVVAYAEVIRHARTVFWTGPMGAWETKPFDVGTKMVALATAHAALINHAQVVAAGGSLRLALERFGLERSMTHVTAGGAATLALLQGKPLPGISVLDRPVEHPQELVSHGTH